MLSETKENGNRAGRPVPRADHLRLSLIENAYSFLNESLRSYRKTGRAIDQWPFALLYITQSIELILKQLLKNVHPILIFEDVDHPKRTVSLELALIRLERVGIAVDEKEKINILRAAHYRNLVVHYEFELNKHECKNIYAQLFEFVHFLHGKHLKSEIHSRIAKENWSVEARLMTYFKKNFVIYNGIEVTKEWPAEIIKAQRIVNFAQDGQKYSRIRYGDESRFLEIDPSFGDTPCHDCAVTKGQYHADGCDVEECPRCHGQFFSFSCGCWSNVMVHQARH